MADLKGKGAMSNRNLIVTVPNSGVQKQNGKPVAYYVDVQIDQSLLKPDAIKKGEKVADTNPHLNSSKFEANKGQKDAHWMTTHRTRYAASQIDKIAKAAGKKIGKTKNGVSYGINASLTPNAKGEIHINTSKPMAPTKNPYFGKNILEKQGAVTKAAQEKAEADYQAKKSEPSKENKETKLPETKAPQAKAASKEADSPAF